MLNPIFIAHRGYTAKYPENTLIALDAARKSGAKYVEVDIQLSADRIPVLFHDRNLQRLCQQAGAIHDYTFNELENFYVTDSEKFADKYVDNKITSLQIFIDYLKKNPELNAFIELKRSMIEKFGEKCVLEILLPLFDGIKEQISFISYDQAILETIHNTTNYSTGIVVDEWSEYDRNATWLSEWVFCAAEGLPKDNTELVIEPKIAVFEVGNIGLAKHLIAKGIVYLETFCIKEMLDVFPVGEKK